MKKWEKPYLNDLSVNMTEEKGGNYNFGCKKCPTLCFHDNNEFKTHVEIVHPGEEWKDLKADAPSVCNS